LPAGGWRFCQASFNHPPFRHVCIGPLSLL